MANPRISYNSKTINFIRPPNRFEVIPFRTRLRNLSASGKVETLNVNAGFSVRIVFSGLRSADAVEGDLKTDLLDLILWIESGRAWSFALDANITVNTTLDAAASAGVISIPVTSATGIVSGSRYVIEEKEHVAIVEASNSATDPVTITRALNVAFINGSRFRAFNYLPMLGQIAILEDYYSQHYNVEITGEVERSTLAV